MNERLDILNGIARQKLELLDGIYNLSLQADGYVNEDEVERLNNVFEAKRDLMNRIDSLDERFLQLFGELKAELGVSSIDELRRSQSPGLDELWGNTANIIAQIQKISALDIKVNEKIEELREHVSADLTRLRKQKNISSLYGNDRPKEKNRAARPRPSAGARFDIKN